MSGETVYADIKFGQAATGKQSSKPEDNGESGTAKQKSSTKKYEPIVKEPVLEKSEPSSKNGIIIFLIFLCFILFTLAIVAFVLWCVLSGLAYVLLALVLCDIQEMQMNVSCHLKTERNDSAISDIQETQMNATCHLKTERNDSAVSGPQCIYQSWCRTNVSGWISFLKNSTYFFSNETRNWADSRNACTSMMSDLVVINSEEEQVFLMNFVNITKTPHWIGLTDQEEEQKWCWVDNRTSLTNDTVYWLENNPDNSTHENKNGEDCATENYSAATMKTWNDDSCNKTYRWICEKNATIFV